MKKIILLAALAAMTALTPTKAAASGGGWLLNVSGTAKVLSYTLTNKITEFSGNINEKYVYELISNAVANVQLTTGTNSIAPTYLPANGYIAFAPNVQFSGITNDPSTNYISGTFYVTNKFGFYYPLSGFDTNGQFYSFMELDTYLLYTTGASVADFELGFGYYNSNVASYSVSGKTGGGSGTSTSTGLLYIHDNPYAYDDLDYPDNFFSAPNYYYGFYYSNNNAIEIRGIVNDHLTLKDFGISGGTLSLTGSGNFVYGGSYYDFTSLITSGSVKLTAQ